MVDMPPLTIPREMNKSEQGCRQFLRRGFQVAAQGYILSGQSIRVYQTAVFLLQRVEAGALLQVLVGAVQGQI